VFKDRLEAAGRLAAKLHMHRGHRPLVLGIPRGAVPMAAKLARDLQGEVDVVLVRKLRAPGNPEFAIGSIEESGWAYLAPHARSTGADDAYIESEKQAQLALIRKRRAEYTAHRPRIDPKGRIVIVVDDGLATGSTMIAALHAIRGQAPARLICAVPVAPPDTAEHVARYCDELVCLETPVDFYAVGQFYQSFPQVDDEEVIEALDQRLE
jgi:predicted phosphoribosyltransferase